MSVTGICQGIFLCEMPPNVGGIFCAVSDYHWFITEIKKTLWKSYTVLFFARSVHKLEHEQWLCLWSSHLESALLLSTAS